MRPPQVSLLFTLSVGVSCFLLLLPLLCSGVENKTVGNVEITADGRLVVENDQELLLDQELKKAFEDAKQTLVAYNDAKSELVSLSNEILQNQDKTSGTSTKIQEAEDMKEEITEKTESIDSAIRDINARQILDLKEKIELLNKRELQRRAKVKQKEALERKRKKQKKLAAMAGTSKIPEGAIKKDDLGELIGVNSILEKSDKELEQWFVEIVDQEVQALQAELEETVLEAADAAGDMEIEEKEETSTGNCAGASLIEAVQIVQEELVKFSNDKVGMVDHLAHAKVVYHLTSNNYVPPSHSYFPLEQSWWFPYLPDDWERGFDAMLPNEWRKWNVAVPDFVYHTFGMTRRAVTAPPEAILRPNIHPGSCWPMVGQSGRVTLRLPYPVKVKAVTIDHASALLFDRDEQRTSAPKNVRVFGFSPCWTKKVNRDADTVSDYLDDYGDDDDEYVRGVCDDGLDFDVESPIVLHDFEFDLDGPSIQTFHIPLPEKDDKGSCSEDTGTCGSGLDGPASGHLYSSPDRSNSINEGVTAIRLQITDNWGNEDFTCIYRFRIHGDAIDPNE